MKILVIVDETFFFHPRFIDRICKDFGNNIKSFLLVTKITKKNSLKHNLIKNYKKLFFSEMIIFSLITLVKLVKDFFYINFNLGHPQSVKNVIKSHKIKFLEVKYSLNSDKLKNFVIDNKIEVILSSNSLYIPKKIREIKNITIINRHSSYLPFNGGVWPAFYAISNNMDFTGVTIHLVNNEIDSGQIVFQKKIKLLSKNLYEIYEICFQESINVILKSFDILQDNKIKLNKNLKNKIIYNSYPKDEDWKKFRKNGGVFVKWKNLVKSFYS